MDPRTLVVALALAAASPSAARAQEAAPAALPTPDPAAAAGPALSDPAPVAPASAPQPWRIVVSSLIDGDFAQLACRPGPTAALSGLGARLAAEPGVLAIDAGDLLGASAVARLAVDRDAAALAQALAATGLQGLALGHRDLSTARKTLFGFLTALRAVGLRPVLSNLKCEPPVGSLCELVEDAGDPPLLLDDPVGGRTALLAFLSPELLAGVAPDRRAGLSLTPLEEEVPRALARARAAGAQRMVVVIDPAGGQELATAVAVAGWAGTADVVVGRELPEAIVAMTMAEQSAPIVAGRRAEVTVFTLGEGARPAGSAAVPAPIATYAAGLGDWLCQGHIQGLRSGRLAEPLNHEGFAGLLLDVVRQAASADVALINRKAIRAGALFPLTGTLTRFDVMAALPFDDAVLTTRVRGAALKAFAAAPRFGQFWVRGVTPSGNTIKVNGRPLEADQWYTVATTGYVAALEADGLGKGLVYERPQVPPPRDLLLTWLDQPDTAGGVVTPPDPAGAARWQLSAGFDGLISDVRLQNPDPVTYNDAQLARTVASSVSLDLRLFAGADHPAFAFQNLLRVEYALARTVTDGKDTGFQESRDLISSRSGLAWRVFRPERRWYHPLPDVEFFLETEFDPPHDDTRDYHHLLLRPTVGARFDLAPRLSFRVGAGMESEVLSANPVKGVGLARLELNPGKLFTLGDRSMEGRFLLETSFLNPWQHLDTQLRASVQISVPLWRWLALTVGYDVFLRAFEGKQVAVSGDLAAGLKLSFDHAVQSF